MTAWVPATELYEDVLLMMEWRAGEPEPNPADYADAIRAVVLEVYQNADLTKPNPIMGVQHLLSHWFVDSLSGRYYAIFVTWSLDHEPPRYDA